MNLKKFSPSLVILALSVCIQSAALPQLAWASDPLGLSSWDSIVSTEHTGEYLAKAGILGTPDIGQNRVMKIAGNWSFDLKDEESMQVGTIMLRLYQSGSILFGHGTLRSGPSSQIVTADGSVMGGSMVLGVVSLKSTNLYQIAITDITGSQVSGTFSAFDPARVDPIKGTISGVKDQPSGLTLAGNA